MYQHAVVVASHPLACFVRLLGKRGSGHLVGRPSICGVRLDEHRWPLCEGADTYNDSMNINHMNDGICIHANATHGGWERLLIKAVSSVIFRNILSFVWGLYNVSGFCLIFRSSAWYNIVGSFVESVCSLFSCGLLVQCVSTFVQYGSDVPCISMGLVVKLFPAHHPPFPLASPYVCTACAVCTYVMLYVVPST